MKLIPSIFKFKEGKPPLLPWPSCKNSTTLSSCKTEKTLSPTLTSEPSFSLPHTTLLSHDNDGDDELSLDMIMCRVRLSQRLFLDYHTTSSITKQAAKTATNNNGVSSSSFNCKESFTAQTLESFDPYSDFKRSMQEIVERKGDFRDNWDFLEDLLGCYLMINDETNRGFIIAAFVDLIIELASSPSTSSSSSCSSSKKKLRYCLDQISSTSYLSALSSFPSPSS